MKRLCASFFLFISGTALVAGTASAQAVSAEILYSFKGKPDGYAPTASLIADAAGNLYTTTAGGGPDDDGTVVKLSPAAAGKTAWTESVLYSFKGGSDGASPYACLIADAAGNLYTTTLNGGAPGDGTVVMLSPPAAGRTTWTERVLYSFKGGSDGSNPYAGLIADAAGNLYTTTFDGGASDDGTVVKLSPPAAGKTAWTESVIYSFKGGSDGAWPSTSLIADTAGNLYTTTYYGGSAGNGTAVKLRRPSLARRCGQKP